MAGPATKTVTIANGASLSDAVNLVGAGDSVLLGIITPAGWTTASLTFQVSTDGVTFFDYKDATGAEVTIPSTAASQYRAVYPTDFIGVRYLKVRSGSSGAAVAQAGGDVVTLVVREL